MINNKFVRLLRTFSKQELGAFKHYLLCFYGKQEKTIALFNYLKKFAPDFSESKKMQLSIASKKIYAKTLSSAKDRKNVLNTLSDLYQYCKEFLLWKTLKKSEEEKELLWLHILKRRQLHHDFLLASKSLAKKFNAKTTRDAWDYLKQFIIYHYLFFNPQSYKHKPNVKSFEESAYFLDLFYVSFKLKYGTERVNRQQMFQEDYKIHLFPEVLNLTKYFQSNAFIHIQKMSYDLVVQKNKSLFQTLKDIFISSSSPLTKTERIILLGYLLNFIASEIRDGKHEYYTEAMELYRRAIDTKLLLENNAISPGSFNNIISVACWEEEYEWAKNFIKNYSGYLEEDIRFPITILAQAIIEFELRAFDAPCFTELQKVKFVNVYFAIRAKTLILKTMFETNQSTESLLRYTRAFERFLSRNMKITGDVLISNQNFVKCFRSLILKKISAEALENKIKLTNPIYFKKWLLSKVIDLRKEAPT